MVHRQEVVLPGVVEDLEQHGPLHPLHLVAGIIASVVLPLAQGQKRRLELIEVVCFEQRDVEIGVEPFAGPADQSVAIQKPGAVLLPTGEMGQSDEDGIFHFAAGVDLAGLALHKCRELFHIEAAGLSLLHLLGIEPDAESPFCPPAGAAQAEVGREESGSF